MELFRLFGSIFVDNEKANESISKTEEKAEGLGGKFVKGVGTAAKFGAAVAGASVVAVGGMVALANKTGEAADFIDKLSERTGINREELQRWKYAAEQSGADVGKLEVGMKKLSQTMVDAGDGSKKSIEAFEALGISMDDLKGKSPSETFDLVAKKLADMPDSAERNAAGNQLLGKSYTELMPLLNAGSDGMQALKDRAGELGLVMSEEAVKANVKFGDTLADVKNSFGAIFMHISNEFLPVLQTVIDWILEHMPEIQAMLSTVFGIIGDLAKGAISVIKGLLEVFDVFFSGTTEGSEGFKATFEAFKLWFGELFETLKEIVSTILEAIKVLWARYGEEITTVVKVVFEGIKIVIQTALNIIKGIIDVMMGILTGDWSKVWEGLKTIVKAVFDGIIKIIPNLLKGIIAIFKGAGKLFLNAGKDMFSAVWDGMKSVWAGISRWVGDKVRWLSDKLMFWRKGNNEMASGGSPRKPRPHGSHAGGLDYVPFDGYIAELHKGEKVLTAEQARQGSGDTFNITINNIINSEYDEDRVMDKLRREVMSLKRAKGALT